MEDIKQQKSMIYTLNWWEKFENGLPKEDIEEFLLDIRNEGIREGLEIARNENT